MYFSVTLVVSFGQGSPLQNVSTTMDTVTRESFTGRYEVFNDPLLDHRLIPDDPAEREGLRVMLLVSNWYSTVIFGYDVINMDLNYQKLMQYYYKEFGNTDGYITLCYGAMVGTYKSFNCFNVTKAEIDANDDYGTFRWVFENAKTAFLSDIIIMPLIFFIGIFGKNIFVSFLLSTASTFFK